MQLPKAIANLVEAQNNHNSIAYTQSFSDTAIVHDEGKTHIGKAEIEKWIRHADEEYQSIMIPVNYTEDGNKSILSAEVSGTFPGSPAVLKFNFTLKDDLIESLRVTG
jgi:hypothetical protein